MHLQSSSKFLEFLKSAGKRVLTSRNTCRTGRVPGGVVSRCGLSRHVAHSENIRRVSRLGHSGHVALSEGIRRVALGVGFRDTWHTRNVSGGWLSVWASGTCSTLGMLPGYLPAGVTRVVGSKMDGSNSIDEFGPGRVEIGPGRMTGLTSGLHL